METNIIFFLRADGSKPSAIVSKLKGIGLKTAIGKYDMKHVWDKEPTEEEILALADKIHDTLKGEMVAFKPETK